MRFGLEQNIATQDIGDVIQFDGQRFKTGKNSPGISSVSNAGLVWKNRVSAGDCYWRSVAYGNGLFVAVASSGVTGFIMTSPDGLVWTIQTISDSQWRSVTYGNGLFVAVASYYSDSGNLVMTSPNGIDWTLRSTPADNQWESVAYGNGLFVAVSSYSDVAGTNIMTSPDGVAWTIRTSPADNGWRSVTYGNGLFVAVASSGVGNRVMTSPNGIDWTVRTSAANNAWYSVCYGNSLFVAVSVDGGNNHVMTSPNGIDWTVVTLSADNQWVSITYGNGLFVAVSYSSGLVMTSPDGVTWIIRAGASDNQWMSVTYGNGLFVAVAQSGIATSRIMTSGGELTTVLPSGLADASQTTVVPTTGASVVIPNSVMTYVVAPAGTIATLTVGMPTAPVHGQIVNLCTGSYGVTALTLNPASGQTFATSAAITALPAGTFASYQYNQPSAVWYRIG